jgi:hypothetical protein
VLTYMYRLACQYHCPLHKATSSDVLRHVKSVTVMKPMKEGPLM